MKNLQKLIFACAAAFVLAVGVFDASAQPNDEWRDAMKSRKKNEREYRKRQREDWREARKRDAEDWREERKREDEFERESEKRWRENERETWKQEKEFRKEQRKRDKEYRKQEKEFRKERRKNIDDDWEEDRDDERQYRRESRRDRDYFPFISRRVDEEPVTDRIYNNDDRFDNGVFDNKNRRLRVAPDYNDVLEDSGSAINFNDLAGRYISEAAAGAGAETNWLTPFLGIFDELFSGNGLNNDLFSAVPQSAPNTDTNLSDLSGIYQLASASAGFDRQ